MFSPQTTRLATTPAFVQKIAFATSGLLKSKNQEACDFCSRGTALARCASPWPKEKFSPGASVERDHQVVGRHAGRGGNAGVDVFQECEPRLLRPPFDEG